MWIKASGDLTENVLQVTTSVSTHLAIFGDEVALVDTGIYPLVQELWDKVEGPLESVEYILLTHSHFDHVGGIPFIREKSPHVKVVSGKLTAEKLKDKDYSENLREKNVAAYKAVHGEDTDFPVDSDTWYKALQVDMVLSDGDDLSLGEGVEVKLINTPGHSEDSVSYFVTPDLALAPGESLGQYNGRDLVSPSFGTNIQQALDSMQKLCALDVQILSLPHSGVLCGELVSRYLLSVPEELAKLDEVVKSRISEGELVEEIASSIAAEWLEEGRFPDGPFQDSHKELVADMVRAIREYIPKDPEAQIEATEEVSVG